MNTGSNNIDYSIDIKRINSLSLKITCYCDRGYGNNKIKDCIITTKELVNFLINR